MDIPNYKTVIRNNINQIIYKMNKYNIFGGSFAYFIALNLNAIVNNNKSKYNHLYSLLSIVIVFSIVKELLTKFLNIKDVCECSNPLGEVYRTKYYETCPTEKSLHNIIYDTKNFIISKTLNFSYKYNIISFIIVLLIGSLNGLLIRTNKLNDFINIFYILLTLVIVKIFFNLFFKAQNYCPCDCVQDKCGGNFTKQVVETELENTLNSNNKNSDILGDLEGELDDKLDVDVSSNLESDLNKLYNDLENETKKILKNTSIEKKIKETPELLKLNTEDLLRFGKNNKLDSDNLIDKKVNLFCKKNVEYDIVEDNITIPKGVEKCLLIISRKPVLREFIVKMLEDDKTYQCIKGQKSETALNSCIQDFVFKNFDRVEQLVKDYMGKNIKKELMEKIKKNNKKTEKKNNKKNTKKVENFENFEYSEDEDAEEVENFENFEYSEDEDAEEVENFENFEYSEDEDAEEVENFSNYEDFNIEDAKERVGYTYNTDKDIKNLSKKEEYLLDVPNKRFRKFCEIDQEITKNKLFKNKQKCLDLILNNDYLRELFTNILQNDNSYDCLIKSKNENNLSECLMRFFADNPEIYQKVIELNKRSKKVNVSSFRDLLYNFKYMLENEFDIITKANKESNSNELDNYYQISKNKKVVLDVPLYRRGKPEISDIHNLSNPSKLEMPYHSREFPTKMNWPLNNTQIINRERNDNELTSFEEVFLKDKQRFDYL